MSREKQEDWKRTQIRMPQEHYQKIMEYAEANNISLNTAMLELMERGFSNKQSELRNNFSGADVRVFNLPNGIRRVVFGKLVNTLDLDYSQSLDLLCKDINIALGALKRSSFLKQLSFLNKDVQAYKGNNHIDVVDYGEKSLGWLKVEDYSPDVIDD